MPAFGVYPIADAQDEGREVSSTYEGRHITVTDTEITGHANPDADGFINKGLPLMVGDKIVGIPFLDAVAGADLISIDTEGIWIVDVLAANDAAGSAVAGGDELYINLTTGVVSKINNTAVNRPFGYALGVITTPGNTETIAVKVHFDPSLDTQDRMYKTVTTGGFGKRWTGLLEAGHSEGVAAYFDGQIDGQMDGLTYGFGMWIEPQAGWIGSASLLVGHDFGFYANDTADPSLTRVVGFQYQSDWNIAPASMYVGRVNINQGRVANPMTAIWAFGNPESCGFIATITEADAPLGYVPWADIVGYGVVYIRVYADQD